MKTNLISLLGIVLVVLGGWGLYGTYAGPPTTADDGPATTAEAEGAPLPLLPGISLLLGAGLIVIGQTKG